MKLRAIGIVIAVAACAPAAGPPLAPMTPDVPVGALAAVAPPVAAELPCAIEGDGEPLDQLFHHQESDLTVSATRGGPPLVQTQGDARHQLHGRWTEIAAAGGDGRAHLELEKSDLFRISGYADLSAVRFRLRKEAAVVPEHVILEVDSLVRVLGVDTGEANVVSEGAFQKPKELPARVRCEDLGYEAIKSKYRDGPEGATQHLTTLRLYDAPRGALRFEADAGLMFVRVLEERDGFVRIEGARSRVRVAGWTPRALVESTAQGAGWGAGSRTSHASSSKGRRARITQKTPLLARIRESTDVPATIGELFAAVKISVLGPDADVAMIAITDGSIAAVPDAALFVRSADIELIP